MALLMAANATVKDVCLKQGGGENVIKAWHVTRQEGKSLEDCVLVLSTTSLYRVTWDPTTRKLLKADITKVCLSVRVVGVVLGLLCVVLSCVVLCD
jgi:hypothetical protein